MNDATIATYCVHEPEIRLDDTTESAKPTAREYPTTRPYTLLNTRSSAANQPRFGFATTLQVREDKGYYIPDILSDEKYDANPETYEAAAKHAKHLHSAEGLLDEAQNLIQLLMASIGDQSDAHAMQTETALKVIDGKLTGVRRRIDKHDRRYTNLFLAYVDQNDKAARKKRQ